MEAWARRGKPKAKAKTKGPRKPNPTFRVRVRAEANEILRAGRWHLAGSEHFVELYGMLHARVYSVEAAELDTGEWTLANMAARRMLAKMFDGDRPKMAGYLKWVWEIQARDEAKRRAGSRDDDFRVTWRYQFSEKLWTQWRIAVERGRT